MPIRVDWRGAVDHGVATGVEVVELWCMDAEGFLAIWDSLVGRREMVDSLLVLAARYSGPFFMGVAAVLLVRCWLSPFPRCRLLISAAAVTALVLVARIARAAIARPRPLYVLEFEPLTEVSRPCRATMLPRRST